MVVKISQSCVLCNAYRNIFHSFPGGCEDVSQIWAPALEDVAMVTDQVAGMRWWKTLPVKRNVSIIFMHPLILLIFASHYHCSLLHVIHPICHVIPSFISFPGQWCCMVNTEVWLLLCNSCSFSCEQWRWATHW